MSTRATLRLPSGETHVRDVVRGRWAEPSGTPSEEVGDGMWALPGLVDAHAHLASGALDFKPGVLHEAQERARTALDAGVTLVLDKGWTDQTVVDVIRTVPEEERPHIEAASRIIAVERGYYPGFGAVVDPSQIAAVVATEAAAGEGWVKIAGDWPRPGQGPVSNFNEAELRSAVEAAESAGAKVAIHTMARDTPTAAVRAGVHSIEHGLFLTGDDIDALGRRSGSWVPTVLRTEAIITDLGGESTGGKLLLEGLENIASLLPAAFEAGVHVLTGTDLVGTPADVADEALRLHEFGLSPAQVLDSVTFGGFSSIGRSASFEHGSQADAVFFTENPLVELGVLRHPAAVFRVGRLR